MEYVVTKKVESKGVVRELFYAGYQAESFSDCGPIFNLTITLKSRFDEKTADAAIKQLVQMGHEVSKRAIRERKPKKGTKGDDHFGQPHYGHSG